MSENGRAAHLIVDPQCRGSRGARVRRGADGFGADPILPARVGPLVEGVARER